MAADYQKLAQNVDAASDKLARSAEAAEAQAEALERARAVVDKLEASLFSLDAQAVKLTQEQADLTRRVAEAATKRDAFRDLYSATGGAQGGQGMKDASAELAALEKELDRATSKLGMLGERSQSAAEALEQGIQAQGKQENKLARAQGEQGQAGQDLAGAQGEKKDAAGASLGGALESIKTATDALMGSFNSLAGTIAPFVQALSPALMEQFSMAMRDVTAVIGQALAPVMQVLTGIVREVGAVLNPVMKQLAPVFDKLAKSLASLLIPIIENAAAMIQTLLPVIELLADALTALTPLFRVISVLQAGLVEFFKELMSSLMGGVDMKGAMASFKSAIEETAKVLIRTAAHIARAFGALSFIEGMIKGINRKTAEKEDSTGMAAPQGAAMTDLSGYGQQVALAAFTATGDLGDEEKKTEEWLKDIAGELKAIKDGPVEIWKKLDEMQEKIKNWLTVDMPKAVADALRKPAFEAGVDLASYANPAAYVARKFFRK